MLVSEKSWKNLIVPGSKALILFTCIYLIVDTIIRFFYELDFSECFMLYYFGFGVWRLLITHFDYHQTVRHGDLSHLNDIDLLRYSNELLNYGVSKEEDSDEWKVGSAKFETKEMTYYTDDLSPYLDMVRPEDSRSVQLVSEWFLEKQDKEE